MSSRKAPRVNWLTTPSPQEQSAVGRNSQRKKHLTTSCKMTLNLKLNPVKHTVFLKKQMGTTQKRVSLRMTQNSTQIYIS